MTQVCDHLFVYDDIYMICNYCGLESVCVPNNVDNINNSCYSVKLPQDDLNKYLVGLNDKIRRDIINIFESLLEENNLRGEGKKALLSACYMYIMLENGNILTYKEACSKFNVVKKKFSEAKQLLVTHYAKYRTIEKKSSDYIEKLYKLFNFKLPEKNTKEIYDDIKQKCYEVDNDLKFVNFNPHSVCACIIYKTLEEKGMNSIKKSEFIKTVGMSEGTVKSILQVLDKTKHESR